MVNSENVKLLPLSYSLKRFSKTKGILNNPLPLVSFSSVENFTLGGSAQDQHLLLGLG